MRIDIDRLSEAELIDLNRRVVERLRLLAQVRAHTQMLAFKVGDRVTFQADGPAPVTGILTRYNKRTVTIIADDGRQWNVSPSLLSKAAPTRTASRPESNVIALKE
ncbi:MAG: hypothetical protein M3Y22_16320 [Pseudomonadota bacterium]|nr:hypothetical protein [Pseudomonadota bacterium]